MAPCLCSDSHGFFFLLRTSTSSSFWQDKISPVAYSNPFWYHPYFKIFFLCLVSLKPGKILKILKIIVWGGQGCHSNCPVFLRFIPSSLKTITNATSCWGTCCKQSRAIGKEDRKEQWGTSCCKGEICQAQGKLREKTWQAFRLCVKSPQHLQCRASAWSVPPRDRRWHDSG